ncbi:MAG: MBL fold metallo-hydrolase [Planctomycetes bacterium]|nr:MBL fold metallo-hydrolase [Planctomycetota bacterium]
MGGPQEMMRTEIALIANEGFRIANDAARIYVDAFFEPVHGRTAPDPTSLGPADLILITHAHWDHFDPPAVARAAEATGAHVIAPADAIRRLRGTVPADRLIEMEPHAARRGSFANDVRIEIPPVSVTAFRTFHGEAHNSYLVRMGAAGANGFRFFHDGDNEDARRIDARALGRVDALLIGPWWESGWVEFIEALAPDRYFLMHLSDDEIRRHEEGRFLPELCDRVPPGLVVLHPGESYVML